MFVKFLARTWRSSKITHLKPFYKIQKLNFSEFLKRFFFDQIMRDFKASLLNQFKFKIE